MKRFTLPFVLAAASAIFAMCSNNNNIPVESNWELEYIYSNGSAIAPPEEHTPTLAFLKDSKIAGETGCNRFFGDYTIKDKNLKFDNVGSTRMMCPQMQFETAYLQVISNTASYSMDDNKLALKDNDGNIIALLEKIEPSAMEN